MGPKEVYVRSLHVQYTAFRLEMIIFTIIFILSMIPIPYVWYLTHVAQNLRLAYLVATVPVFIGLSMATHCGNTLQSLRRIASALNKEMGEYKTFEYDLGKENDPLRYGVTLAAKIIGALLLIWCFSPWPKI